jgi:hypothetical protein
MGYYINKIEGVDLPAKGKVQVLIDNGAEELNGNINFQENLVCVVENMFFDAVGYVFSQSEFDAFNHPSDDRKKTWLIVPNAPELAGYKKY